MKNLISIKQQQLNGAAIQTVNARELHGFLESKQDFSTWIKARIDQYGFEEGADYLIHKFVDNPMGGRPTVDYHLTFDMAKELSMVERNDKGKEARQYFLECERQAKATQQFQIPQTLPDALRLAAELADQNNALEIKVSEQAPKVEALDRIANADGSMCITDAAKLLQIRPKEFFAWLFEHKWIYHRSGKAGWLAYQERLQSGLLEHKITTVERSDGTEKVIEQVRILPRGLAKLAEHLSLS